MAIVRLKIDVSGTTGDEAWRNLRQFDEIQSAKFGTQCGETRWNGDGGRDTSHLREACKHPANVPHPEGEWIAAEIRLQTPLLAQYAVAHYLKQDRVLDADVVE